jgi:hypothetical protein
MGTFIGFQERERERWELLETGKEHRWELVETDRGHQVGKEASSLEESIGHQVCQ